MEITGKYKHNRHLQQKNTIPLNNNPSSNNNMYLCVI